MTRVYLKKEVQRKAGSYGSEVWEEKILGASPLCGDQAFRCNPGRMGPCVFLLPALIYFGLRA
jgi:hypothetical protein